MSEWTPTTTQVRDGYRFDPEDDYRDPINAPMRANEAGRAFDRWLAAHDEQVRAEALQEERERIAVAIDDLEHNGEEARRLVRTGEQEVAWIDGYARAVFDAARIARQGGSDDER